MKTLLINALTCPSCGAGDGVKGERLLRCVSSHRVAASRISFYICRQCAARFKVIWRLTGVDVPIPQRG